MNLYDYKGFALSAYDSSYEARYLLMLSLHTGIEVKRIGSGKCPPDYVPCGSVEWCEDSLGHIVAPDYYPEWVSQFLFRSVWVTDKFPLEKGVFIKPNDRHKRLNGFITKGGYKGKKRPPYICSEVVSFTNEWRYYISNGQVVDTGWYWGDEVKEIGRLTAGYDLQVAEEIIRLRKQKNLEEGV